MMLDNLFMIQTKQCMKTERMALHLYLRFEFQHFFLQLVEDLRWMKDLGL